MPPLARAAAAFAAPTSLAVFLGAVQTKVSSHLRWLLGLLRECH